LPPCPFINKVAIMAQPPSSPPQAEPPAAPAAAPSPARGTPPVAAPSPARRTPPAAAPSPARGTPPASGPPPSVPPVPPLPFVDTGSRARAHVRDVLLRLHADAVVFAQPCARCVSRGETCWGQVSGAVSKKCGPCVYGGKPCGVARDQVSRPSRSLCLVILIEYNHSMAVPSRQSVPRRRVARPPPLVPPPLRLAPLPRRLVLLPRRPAPSPLRLVSLRRPLVLLPRRLAPLPRRLAPLPRLARSVSPPTRRRSWTASASTRLKKRQLTSVSQREELLLT
jgi:hypothetical protein